MNNRGMGRVFRPSYTDKKTGKLKQSSRWHIEFWTNGTPHRKKTGSRQRADAVKLLKQRTGESQIGTLLPSDVAKTTFEDLRRLIRQDYLNNSRRTASLDVVLKRLDRTFSGMKASEITAARIIHYQTQQKTSDLAYANTSSDSDLREQRRKK